MPKDHRGQPSGSNKSEGTGEPSNLENKQMDHDEELTDQYTDDDKTVTENVKQNHPNRNVNKGEATNDGGYKN